MPPFITANSALRHKWLLLPSKIDPHKPSDESLLRGFWGRFPVRVHRRGIDEPGTGTAYQNVRLTTGDKTMKRNKLSLTLVALSLMVLSSPPVMARHHEGYGNGMWYHNASPLSADQQAAAQRITADYAGQTYALRQQLMAKRYEYNTLLTASAPDDAKINAVAKEVSSLEQSLNEQRVKRDILQAQAGIPRSIGVGYRGCDGSRRGMGYW
jgi:zinc resistance-associated protein